MKDIAVAALIGWASVMALQAMPWPPRALVSAQLLHLCIAQMPVKNPPIAHTNVASRASPSVTVRPRRDSWLETAAASAQDDSSRALAATVAIR